MTTQEAKLTTDNQNIQQIHAYVKEYIGNFSKEHECPVSHLPVFKVEQEDSMIEFPLLALTRTIFLLKFNEALQQIKTACASLSIDTFEDNYILLKGNSMQDAGELRFRFIFFKTQQKVCVQKKSILSIADAIIACKLFEIFYDATDKKDPRIVLNSLGVKVYDYDVRKDIIKDKEQEKNETPTLNFQNSTLAGYGKIKKEILQNVILPLNYPHIFEQIAKNTRGLAQSSLPRAVLFTGPPGVGKTSIAKMIAQESNLTLLYVSVENIMSKYYGESAKNLAKIFDMAILYDRVILFIDEIDALAVQRNQNMFEATRRILSVLLQKLDGFIEHRHVLTIAATNRHEDLDPALLSRFDPMIAFHLPTLEDRKRIFHYYAKHLSAVELEKLSKMTQEFSGRKIKDLCLKAERSFTLRLLEENKQSLVSDTTVPPVAFYIESIKGYSLR